MRYGGQWPPPNYVGTVGGGPSVASGYLYILVILTHLGEGYWYQFPCSCFRVQNHLRDFPDKNIFPEEEGFSLGKIFHFHFLSLDSVSVTECQGTPPTKILLMIFPIILKYLDIVVIYHFLFYPTFPTDFLIWIIYVGGGGGLWLQYQPLREIFCPVMLPTINDTCTCHTMYLILNITQPFSDSIYIVIAPVLSLFGCNPIQHYCQRLWPAPHNNIH